MNLDSASLTRLGLIYPDIKVRLIRVYNDMLTHHGQQMKCAMTIRSVKQQNDLYAQGRTSPGKIVTWAKGGKSYHNYGCAADSAFMGPDPYLEHTSDEGLFLWSEFGRFSKAHGLYWGGDFPPGKKDRPHVQLTYGQTLAQIQALYQHGGIPAVWAKFDQIRGIPEETEWKNIRDKIVVF